MKIIVYSRPITAHDPDDLRVLTRELVDSGLDFAFNEEFAPQIGSVTGTEVPSVGYPEADRPGADIAVSFGGDGTFLDCVRVYGRTGAAILGINSGRLGFLANVPMDGIRAALDDIREGRYDVESRIMIRAEGGFPQEPEFPYAFNEFSIQRSGTSMISVETFIDGEMVATYWGDGVILSTPAGSTAYSLSVGGPVVAPGCGCLIISPIAPHNLTMRPVVVPETSAVTFRVRSREGTAFATMDNTHFEVSSGAEFTVRKAENSVFLVRLQNISFYQTLRNKMLWGLDSREGTEG